MLGNLFHTHIYIYIYTYISYIHIYIYKYIYTYIYIVEGNVTDAIKTRHPQASHFEFPTAGLTAHQEGRRIAGEDACLKEQTLGAFYLGKLGK
jgi:hypothetical protein